MKLLIVLLMFGLGFIASSQSLSPVKLGLSDPLLLARSHSEGTVMVW